MANQKPSKLTQGSESEPRPGTEENPANSDPQRLEDLDFLHAPGFVGRLEEDQMPWRAEDCVEPG